jgi:hypothetical protein
MLSAMAPWAGVVVVMGVSPGAATDFGVLYP